MKLVEHNQRQGIVRLIIDSPDDLWYLHAIVDTKDTCTGDSEYKYKLGGTSEKSQIIKKKVWVRIEVESKEYSGTVLRITGKVVDGSEDVPRGSYHTLDIVEGSKLAIIKHRWHSYQLEKLDEALSGGAKTLILLYDREHAIFTLLSPRGKEHLLELKGDVPRKGVDEGRQHAFYQEVCLHAAQLAERHDVNAVIAASPSFWKDYLEKELTPELRKKIIFASVSTADETAIKELLERPELEQALRKQRVTKEAQLLEQVRLALAKDKLVYGSNDLKAALLEGNISMLVIDQHSLQRAKEQHNFTIYEELLDLASAIKASVHMVSTEEAAHMINGFGGVVGVKRW